MQLKPAQVSGHLQKGLALAYVVAGEEPLLIQESLDAIRARARKDGYTEREVLDAERGFEWQKLVDACASLSLFASRRIIELRLTGSPGDEGSRVLQQLAQKAQRDTLLIVVTGKLEGKQRNAAWFTALESAGASVYAWPVAAAELPRWLEARLAAAGLAADSEAIRGIAERTEGNLLAAAQDIAKLKLLFPEGRVGIAEVQAAVADSARFDSFDLSDKILDGDSAGAYRSLKRLREEGAELPELVGALAFTLRQWAHAAAHYARSRDAAAALEAAGVWRARQAAFGKAVKTAPHEAVLGWWRALSSIDQKLKSGSGEAAWEELIASVVAACRRSPLPA